MNESTNVSKSDDTSALAQQYFPATVVSLCLHSHKEKFGACFSNVIVFFF